MKIWLNDRKIKESDHFILCDECALNRKRNDEYTHQCLAAMLFHLYEQSCIRGYQYEDKV